MGMEKLEVRKSGLFHLVLLNDISQYAFVNVPGPKSQLSLNLGVEFSASLFLCYRSQANSSTDLLITPCFGNNRNNHY